MCPFEQWPNSVGPVSTEDDSVEQTFTMNITQGKDEVLTDSVQTVPKRPKWKEKNQKRENLLIYYSNIETLSNKMRELEVVVNLHKPNIIALAEVKPKNG